MALNSGISKGTLKQGHSRTRLSVAHSVRTRWREVGREGNAMVWRASWADVTAWNHSQSGNSFCCAISSLLPSNLFWVTAHMSGCFQLQRHQEIAQKTIVDKLSWALLILINAFCIPGTSSSVVFLFLLCCWCSLHRPLSPSLRLLEREPLLL